MKAAIYRTYGPPEVLRIAEVPKPEPKEDEVLVRVYMSTVNRTDTGYRSAKYVISRLFTGLLKPKQPICGSEYAGKIEAVGGSVTEFSVGDRVFGFDDVRSGAHAEFVAKKTSGAIALIPDGLSYSQAAPAGEGATYALSTITAARVQKGQQVLVYGASGAIGSAAVQILKDMGAGVVAVCGTKNVQLVQQLGADRVVDYQTEDFTQINLKFDFIFDAVGKSSYGACKKILAPNGIYCSTELGRYGQNPLLALWFALTGRHSVIFPIPKINKQNILYIARLLAAESFKPVVDRTYALEDIVAATAYVETEQKTGSVLIKIADETNTAKSE